MPETQPSEKQDETQDTAPNPAVHADTDATTDAEPDTDGAAVTPAEPAAPTAAEPAAEQAPAPAAAVRQPDPVLPKRLLFRIPAAALVGVAFLVLCESLVAFAGIWFTLLYLIPLGLAYWVVRTRTVIDVDAIEVRRALTKTRIPWSAVASLRVREAKWVRAVLADGREITLPSVHTRHLSALAVISNGRITDPLADRDSTPEPAEDNAEDNGADAGETSSTAEQDKAAE